MEQIIQKENNINNSNMQSTLDTNKNTFIYYNNGNYFSFGKDNSLTNKSVPNTSSFNIKENIKQSSNITNNITNNNSFLNKKRKLMTSEELELEQIERERKEVKKMMQKNMALYYRIKSGTTTIVSKIRDNIYNINNNNKNTILNSYINNNNNNNNFFLNQNIDKNKNNSYVMNYLKEKGINAIKDIHKNVHNDNVINKTEISNNININDKVSVKDEICNKNENIISLCEENDKEEVNKVDESNIKNNEKEHEPEIVNLEKEKENAVEILANKTPDKESSYLTKIKKLGSMSKLSLCNKIQKYTEICKEVLKEQEEGEDNKEEKRKEKKGKKGKKKIKNSHSKK